MRHDRGRIISLPLLAAIFSTSAIKMDMIENLLKTFL